MVARLRPAQAQPYSYQRSLEIGEGLRRLPVVCPCLLQLCQRLSGSMAATPQVAEFLRRGQRQRRQRWRSLAPDAAQFAQENRDRRVADALAQRLEPRFQVARVDCCRMQRIEIAGVVAQQCSAYGKQLGGGLEVVARVAAGIEDGHQPIPAGIEHALRGKHAACGKLAPGAGGERFRNARPIQYRGEKPLEALDAVRSGFDAERCRITSAMAAHQYGGGDMRFGHGAASWISRSSLRVSAVPNSAHSISMRAQIASNSSPRANATCATLSETGSSSMRINLFCANITLNRQERSLRSNGWTA